MSLREIAEFSSATFAPFLPDDSQVNPQVYGAELAWWLAKQLAVRGVFTSYPQNEDWGWYIEYRTKDGSEFAVHCYNVDGAADRWLLALRRFGRKLFGTHKPPYSDARDLIAGIRAALASESSITDLRWLYEQNKHLSGG